MAGVDERTSIAPADRRRVGTRRHGRPRRDAVTLLSVYAVLLLILPSRLVFSALGGSGTPALVIGLLALVLWLTARRTLPEGSVAARPVYVAIVVYVLVDLASYARAMLHSLDPVEVRSADRALLALGAAAGIALVAADGIASRERLNVLLTRVVTAAAVCSAIAVLQFGGIDLTKHFYVPGLHATSVLGSGSVRASFHRVAGTARHPIELGAALAMVLPIALSLAYHCDPRERRWRWLCVALLGLAIPMSLSRTAMIGVLVVVLIMLPSWSPSRQRRALAIGGGWALAMWLAVPGLLGSIKSLFANYGSDSSVTERTLRYAKIGGLLRHHVLFGRGIGTFVPEKYFIFDNQYIVTVLEVGLIGLAGLWLVMFVSIGCARGARRLLSDEAGRDLAQAFAASAAVPLFVFATFDAMSFPMVPGMMFLVLGCAGALWRMAREPQTLRANATGEPTAGPIGAETR